MSFVPHGAGPGPTPVDDAPRPHPAPLHMLRLVWPFVVTVGVLLAMAVLSFEMLAAAQAYVKGESLWSKGQKDALLSLARYSDTCDPRDLARFEREIRVPLGDRRAREALLATPPDTAAAFDGFVVGGNDPDDVPRMITLFHQAQPLAPFQRAVERWTQADALMDEMITLARSLQRELPGCATPAQRLAVMARVNWLNDALTPLQRDFSQALSEANQLLRTVLLLTMIVSALALTAMGLLLVRRGLLSARRAEEALVVSEYRLRMAANGSNLGVWDLDLRCDRLYMSEAMRLEIGLRLVDGAVRGMEVLDLVHRDDRTEVLHRLTGEAPDGDERFDRRFRILTRCGLYRWYRLAGQRLVDDDGEVWRVIGSVQDVTEAQALERALHEERERRAEVLRLLRPWLSPSAPGRGDTPAEVVRLAELRRLARALDQADGKPTTPSLSSMEASVTADRPAQDCPQR